MKCTGRNCPMQIGAVDPAHCLADECPYLTKPLTNADRIRAMPDADIARWYCTNRLCGTCKYCSSSGCTLLEWLKQEAEG